MTTVNNKEGGYASMPRSLVLPMATTRIISRRMAGQQPCANSARLTPAIPPLPGALRGEGAQARQLDTAKAQPVPTREQQVRVETEKSARRETAAIFHLLDCPSGFRANVTNASARARSRL